MSVGDPCSVAGCDRVQTPKSARGMCPLHYKRQAAGAEMAGVPKLPNGEAVKAFERLLATATDACVLWPYGRTRQGYGKMTVDGQAVNVHVAALERTSGPRPSPNHDAAHSCRNRHCMNPLHLRWATKSENSLDRHRDGTCVQAKLTAADVLTIRRHLAAGDVAQAQLAERFGVSVSTIEYIKARKIWAHIPEEDA